MQPTFIGHTRQSVAAGRSWWLRLCCVCFLGIAAGSWLACSRPPALLPSPQVVEDGVVFRFRAPAAQTVQLAGSWMGNSRLRGRDWSAGTRVGLMQPAADDAGVWELKVPLTTGRYEYLFLVNGRFWELDPANPQRSPDGSGGQVSILVVR